MRTIGNGGLGTFTQACQISPSDFSHGGVRFHANFCKLVTFEMWQMSKGNAASPMT